MKTSLQIRKIPQKIAEIIQKLILQPRSMIHERKNRKKGFFLFLTKKLGGLANSKKTGAWKGKLMKFFVNPKEVERAKNGTNII